MSAAKKFSLLLLFVLMSSTRVVWADEIFDIVTDPWPPYAYEEDGKAAGTDVEITLAVFKKMGLTANIQFLPWKRCLGLMKVKKADAILAASVTEERKEFLHFPAEPVSTGVTVFFKKKLSPVSAIDLTNPQGLRVAAVLGYKYCDELDNSRLLENASRVTELEQSFNMLLRDRIDLAIAIEPVGYYTSQKMKISDQLAVVADGRYCHGGNYLAFAKKPEYEKLAALFSETLTEFKTTNEYQKILQKYGKFQ